MNDLDDVNTEPELPETCMTEASLLLLLTLRKAVCRDMLTNSPDHFEYFQQRLRELGWHLEKERDGNWISLADDADPPVPGFEDYRSYVEQRVLYDRDGRFVRNTLKEELFGRLWDHVRYSNEVQGVPELTVAPCLRPGESTACPFVEDDEEEDGSQEIPPISATLG